MNRDLRELAIILSPNSPRFERLFWRPKLATWRAILGFWPETMEIMYKTLQILYESWTTRSRDHFEPKLASVGANFLSAKNSPRFERLFWRPKIGSFEGHFGFSDQNAGNHVQIMAIIVWIVIYACSRSFWAQTRRDLREFFDGPKFAPWRACCVFGPKRWKSCTKHCKYCMNRDLRVLAIILSPNSTRFERICWRPKIGSLEGHFGFFSPNAWNHVQIMANIIWIVIYAFPRSFWAQNSTRFERIFWRPKICSLQGHFGFLAQNAGYHVQTMAIVVWIVFYALPRSFWAQTRGDLSRLGWGEFFVGQKLASIWETFLTAQNWLLRGPFWVFGPKRRKSCTNHGYYCMNRDLRLLAIILSSNSTWFERIFWRPKICSLEGLLCFWPETLEIMYKTLQILYESWSTRFRNH